MTHFMDFTARQFGVQKWELLDGRQSVCLKLKHPLSALERIVSTGGLPNMEFKLGEKVVYPNHGVGVIEQISYGYMNGRSERYYMLRIVSSGLKVMVPQTNIANVGLRSVIRTHGSHAGSVLSREGPLRIPPRLEASLQGKLRAHAHRIVDGSSRSAEGIGGIEPDQTTFLPREEDAGTGQVSADQRACYRQELLGTKHGVFGG